MSDVEGKVRTKNPKFKIGDHVTRPRNVYDQKSKLMHGTVVRVYSRKTTHFGEYPELYDVHWDEMDATDQSYLPHGLDKA